MAHAAAAVEAEGTVASVKTAEGEPKVNGWTWAALAAGAVVLTLLAARRLAARPRPTLDAVIAEGLAETWARRFGAPQDRIRSALNGRDGAMRGRIDDLVEKVSCTFRQETDADRRHLVVVVLCCDYRDGDSVEVTMRIPWRRVPSGVRHELLQARTRVAVKTWIVG